MIVALAQLNPIVGDLPGNVRKLRESLALHRNHSPDLLVFSELFLTGYPPKDLLERPWFIENVTRAVRDVEEISKGYPGTGILFGTPIPIGSCNEKPLYNGAVLVYEGKTIGTAAKTLLPTYDVFDESRYFEPAPQIKPIPFKDQRLGVNICEDAWNTPDFWPGGIQYEIDPIELLSRQGTTLFINLSASPFTVGKEELRYRIIKRHAQRTATPFVYLNQVGANDELIFDGRSLVFNRAGQPVRVLSAFTEELAIWDSSRTEKPCSYTPLDRIETVYQALVLGIRDYVRKCGFSQVVIGLSGGIDSALVFCLAVEALGPDNVLGVTMPSPFSSPGSINDSLTLARNFGASCHVIPINGIYERYLETLRESFAGHESDTTEENLQARIRGNILMAFSNKFGYLVLSTGNKSEMAVGYCTLYGDMSGGLSVLSDVPKTMVYQLATHINRYHPVIPRESIEKAPSAELKPDQKDQDTLPPYPVLDEILAAYIEDLLPPEEIIRRGYDETVVRWVVSAVERNEYKRKQAAPGLKVTSKAFGIGRRMPIAARCPLD
ncbi:MAG TPA: NAD+ synthase [Atribacteraceae bacterium]|nr:NAD+ synthase [Atribacteraceae bacterium]